MLHINFNHPLYVLFYLCQIDDDAHITCFSLLGVCASYECFKLVIDVNVSWEFVKRKIDDRVWICILIDCEIRALSVLCLPCLFLFSLLLFSYYNQMAPKSANMKGFYRQKKTTKSASKRKNLVKKSPIIPTEPTGILLSGSTILLSVTPLYSSHNMCDV